MKHIEYFRRQAKNLFKDYQTKTPYIDSVDGNSYYKYDPKYFDMEDIVFVFNLDEDNFSLMKAQHIISYMAGFNKWTDLLKATAAELELAKLLFDNQDKILIEEWKDYICGVECDNFITFDAEAKIEIFKKVFLSEEISENSSALDDQFKHDQNIDSIASGVSQPDQSTQASSDTQITSLPLSMEDRAEFVEIANSVFKTVLLRMMPRNPGLIRKLWNAEHYVDNMLTEDMLPISRDYAGSLIDAFLVHHVAELSTQADKMAGRPDFN